MKSHRVEGSEKGMLGCGTHARKSRIPNSPFGQHNSLSASMKDISGMMRECEEDDRDDFSKQLQ